VKVLVIDDDAEAREMVRVALSLDGIEVLEASGGAEGISLASQACPDGIVLDVMMPFMDGPATLAELRKGRATAGIPVMFLTASVMPSEVRRLQEMGAVAVLAKPFEPMTLAKRVREIVGKRAPERGTAAVVPAPDEEFELLRAQFVRRSQAKIEVAGGLLTALERDPGDTRSLQDLMRFFHGLAGVGSSFGFPRVTGVAKEGELGCLALLRGEARPSSSELENWSRLLVALTHELSTTPAASPVSGPVGHGSRAPVVLIVDADEAVYRSLAPLLEQEGVTSRPLRSRAEALEALQRSMPDGVIVDASLPDGSGYDLIDRLRSLPGGEAVPALMLSPRAGFLDKVEAIHCGADGYFEKPVDWKALMRRLQHLLEASQPHPARILSVEDDPQQGGYLKAILESGGYEAAVCQDPKGFEAALEEFQPDLVLMDILLPEISGYDLVRYLRQDERYATLPVLFLTTDGQMQSRFRSAQVGGDDHLVKPVVPPVLLSVVAARLERARFLKNLLNRDGLTRLLTHTALIERAQAVHAQKRRDAARVCAWVMIDLDHFKSINDRFGHPVGDRVLAALAALLRRRLRQSDVIGRYGGEEFAVILEGLPEDEVVRLIARVLEEFRNQDLEAAGHPPFRATFSAGVAMLGPAMGLDEWKKAADDALYASKHGGRNRVSAAPSVSAGAPPDGGPAPAGPSAVA
jgi:diguanylate cyclase (GGDEF)-like protein